MNLNRKITPDFHKISTLHFPEILKTEASNELTVYGIRAGMQPVIRLDLVFEAGLTSQLKKAVSSFTLSMLSEGTTKRSAQELADSLDYYGSYFQCRSNPHDAVATLYCLEKHLVSCLEYFIEALTDSIFPLNELEIQKRNSIQKLMVSEKKNSYQSRKNFYKTLLGETHPYAAFSEKADIENISRELLLQQYETTILNGLKYAILSGNFKESTLQQISDAIQKAGLKKSNSSINLTAHKINQHGKKVFIEKNDSVQSSVRIGKTTVKRSHPDFQKLQFLNLIFGGYFGSRLMKNIREDKGLTYGIYSVIEPYQELSIWYIDSDINTKNRGEGVKEIYKELHQIQNQMIGNDELNIARNYFLGSFLRGLDGPFGLADRLKIIIDYNLPTDYYISYVNVLNAITAGQLLETAQKYLGEENLVEVIVGKNK